MQLMKRLRRPSLGVHIGKEDSALKNGVVMLRYQHALIAGFAFLFLTGAAAILLSIQQEAAARGVRHTLETVDQVNRVFNLVVRAESGQRGYLLTARTDYLTPYTEARQALPAQLDRLMSLTRTETGEQADIANLLADIGRKLSELKKTIDLRAADELPAALRVVNDDIGSSLMNKINDEVRHLGVAETDALENNTRRFYLLNNVARATLVLAILAVLILGFIAVGETQQRVEALTAANNRLRAEAASREAAESKLVQLQKMEAVGQLTGGIAHDFNNMLAVIIGSLDLARRRVTEQDFAQSLRYISSATDGATRAASLTARLLAFSRQQPLQPTILDVNKLVSGMSDLLDRTLGTFGDHIHIETVLAGGLWRAFADAVQVENALINLAVNARDAMPNGGKLTIETGNADLDDRYAAEHTDVYAGQYVQISVTDTGSGMSPEIIARAFDPFFSTKGVGKGTGLGLSQVYGFVKQSGGHVKIYSEIGRGTTIRIYLPRHRSDNDLAVCVAKVGPVTGSADEVILVVEDDPQVRHMTVEACRTLGYTVKEADTAKIALRLLETAWPITLLLTDVVMPEVDGRVLWEKAHERRPSLKVLFTTGYTRNAIVHNGVVDSDKPFLSKPFSVEQLGAKLRQVLDGSR